MGSFEEPHDVLGHSDRTDIKELRRLYWIHDIMTQGHTFLRRRRARWISGIEVSGRHVHTARCHLSIQSDEEELALCKEQR